MREGWRIVKLDEIISFERGLTYAKGDEVAHSSVGVLRSNNVDLTTQSLNLDEIKYLREDFEVPEKKKVRKSSLLMCMSNGSKDHLGKVALIDEDLDYAFGGFMGLLTPDETKVVPKYLYYALASKSFKDYIHSLADGANINNLKYKDLAAYDILLLPLPEQQRIVDILDREFAKIDALKANAEKSLQAAKDLFQAVLKKELAPKEGWISATLGKLYDVRDGTHDSPKYVSEGYPFITSKNLKDGKVDMSDVKFISQNDYEKINERSKVDIGDVLFAMIGSNLGHPAIVEEEPNYAIKNVALFKVPPSQSSRLLLFLLSSDKIMEVMNKEKNGSSQPFVSLKYLRNFVVSIPETRNEQENLAMSIQSISDRHKQLQQNYQKALTLCDDLKQALLRKAFSGDL